MPTVTHPDRTHTAPCRRCGSTDRYKSGECIPCLTAARRKRAEELKHTPCDKCGELERSAANGRCLVCDRARSIALRRQREGQPCAACGDTNWLPTGRCRTCASRVNRKYRIERERLGIPCTKCGRVDYEPNGTCRHCARLRLLARDRCSVCGSPDLRESGKCRPCGVRWAREWRKANPVQASAYRNRRRARELGAQGSYSAQDVLDRYEAQKGRCWWCRKKVGDDYEVDHVIALARGGTNYPSNICISCPACNRAKHARMPWEFAGRLF